MLLLPGDIICPSSVTCCCYCQSHSLSLSVRVSDCLQVCWSQSRVTPPASHLCNQEPHLCNHVFRKYSALPLPIRHIQSATSKQGALLWVLHSITHPFLLFLLTCSCLTSDSVFCNFSGSPQLKSCTTIFVLQGLKVEIVQVPLRTWNVLHKSPCDTKKWKMATQRITWWRCSESTS